MNNDELRDSIWDHLFQAKAPQSIEDLATLTSCDIAAVGAAVSHEWFNVTDGGVSIAFAAPPAGIRR